MGLQPASFLDGIMSPASMGKYRRRVLSAALVLALASLALGDRTFYIVNNLDYAVWMAAIGRPNPDFGTGYAPPHSVIELKVPDDWSSARVWARTGCDFSKPGTLCETGDCGSGRADCAGLSGEPPVTLAEMTLGATDFYDISNVDGYNLPMQMVPVAHTFEPLSPNFDPKKAMYYCEQTGCFSDLNQKCLPQNKQINSLGQTVACTNTVTVEAARKNISEYATDEYKLFKGACPDAYAFPYDDAASTFVCNGRPDYKIIFGWDTATNIAPRIEFKNPVNNQNFAVAGPITIQAHIEDLDGVITEYEFLADGQSLGGKKSGAEGDFSQVWTPPGPGTYTLSITAKDNEGLSKTETIKVTIGATSKIPLPTATLATGGYYLDRDGDGRIETAVVAFDSNFKAPPTTIAFADPFLKSNKAESSGSTVSNSIITYTLDPSMPFTPGTGFPPEPLADISPDSKYAAQSVRMEDRVGPVLASATSFPTAKPAASAEVEITFSEPVALDPDPPVFPLEIKRKGAVMAEGEINVISIHSVSPVGYRIVFAPASKYPVPGDSVRINPSRPVKDMVGNRSNMQIFVPVKGSATQDTVSFSYILKNGLTENILGPAVGPVTSPMVIHGDKVCIGCESPHIRELLPAMEPDLLATVGPTWIVTTKYPFDFTLMFYDNLGQFVNQARGDISVADFDLLKATESVAGDSVAVQLTFLPLSREGNQLATGAYIMRGELRIHDIPGLLGSQGEPIMVVPVSRRISSRFGLLRTR